MKLIPSRFAAVCMYLFMSAEVGRAEDAARFAAIIPLSGNGAEQGLWIKRGLELAQDDMREKGHLAPEVIFEDSQGQNTLAISAFRKVIATRRTVAIVTWGSGVGLSLSPMMNQEKVVQMGVATSANSYSSPGDYNFRNYPFASEEAAFLANLAIKRFGKEELVVVHSENDYGTTTAEMFVKSFEKLGGKVKLSLALQPGETNTATHALRVKSAKPKAVFVAAYPVEGSAFLKHLRQLGGNAPVIGSVALSSSHESLQALGSAVNGLILSAGIRQIPPNSPFIAKYEKRFQEPFGPQHFYAVRAYDAYVALATATTSCGEHPDGTCVKDALLRMGTLDAVGGPLKFDENGDVASEFSAYEIQDGKYVTVE